MSVEQVVRHGTSIFASLGNSCVLLEGQLIEVPGFGHGSSVCSDDSRAEDTSADHVLLSPRMQTNPSMRPTPIIVCTYDLHSSCTGNVNLNLCHQLVCMNSEICLLCDCRLEAWKHHLCCSIPGRTRSWVEMCTRVSFTMCLEILLLSCLHHMRSTWCSGLQSHLFSLLAVIPFHRQELKHFLSRT